MQLKYAFVHKFDWVKKDDLIRMKLHLVYKVTGNVRHMILYVMMP